MRIFKYIYFSIMFCAMIAGIVLFCISKPYDKLQLLGAFLMLTGSGVCCGIFVGDMGHE